MRFEKVYLITGNSDKFSTASSVFKETGVKLEQLNLDYQEIQASNSMKIAEYTVKQVIGSYDYPVIREDHSFYLDALPGFPGPYMSYFDQELSAEKLLEIIEGKSRTGYFEISAVLGTPSGKIRRYSFNVDIKIAEDIHGEEGNWDRVMMLRDSDKTFAETASDSRKDLWSQNFRKIARELKSQR